MIGVSQKRDIWGRRRTDRGRMPCDEGTDQGDTTEAKEYQRANHQKPGEKDNANRFRPPQLSEFGGVHGWLVVNKLEFLKRVC